MNAQLAHPTRISTADMSHEQWLALRRHSIGASDAAAVVGENPWKTPYALWAEKVGAIEPEDLSDNDAVQLGLRLEDWVAREFSERTSLRVHRDNCIRVHPRFAFITTNLDRRVVGEPAVLECKIAGANAAMGDEWGDEWTDQIPRRYIVQLQHQMLATDFQRAYLAVLLASTQFRVYKVDVDPAITEMLVAAHQEFWRYVETGTPPPITTMEDAKRAYPLSDGDAAEATEEVVAACERLRELKSRIDDLDASAESLQAMVCAFMGDAAELRYRAKKLATWKTQDDTRLDTSALKDAHPEVYAQFARTTQRRVFRLSKGAP